MGSHIGLWDKFFGKRLTLELPQPDGTTVRVQVTAKWLREMERQGNIQRNETAATPTTLSARELDVHEGAALLVPGARIFAASFYSDLTRTVPEVQQLFGVGARELEVWDCLLAVAAVGVAYEALVRANGGMQPQVERIIDPAMREFHPDGVEILRNFEIFVQQGRFDTGLYETVVGAWVVCSLADLLFGRSPTDEQSALSEKLGRAIVAAFDGWWTPEHPLRAIARSLA